MIWDWLFHFIADRVVQFFNDLRGLIPPPPSFFSDAAGLVSQLVSWLRPVSAWVDFPMGVIVLTAVASCWVVALAIKITRIVASFATLGGGGAG